MGYNTTLVVMNDALDAIEKDPDFGKNLAKAIRSLSVRGNGEGVDVPAGGHVNAATVIEQHHADYYVVVAVGGNLGKVLGYGGGYRNDNEMILQVVADTMGFGLRKKRGPHE